MFSVPLLFTLFTHTREEIMKNPTYEHLRLLQAAEQARGILRLCITSGVEERARDAMGRAAAVLTAGMKARKGRGVKRSFEPESPRVAALRSLSSGSD